MTYKAAVIIPSRGGRDRLPALLDALEKQTEKNFQVIVVVDEDIDGTEAYLSNFKETSSIELTTIVFPENRGRTQALNSGHEAADAEVLIRCDDDLLPSENYVARHIELHTGNEETGVIGIYLNVLPDTPYARAYGRYRDEKFRETAYQVSEDQAWHYWAGNCSMSQKMYREIGGYDSRYRLYGWEDVDMGYELYKRGVKIIIDPELATTHRVAATTSAIRAKRALYSGAARDIFVKKQGDNVLQSPVPTGLWGLIVKTTALVCTEKNIEIMGNAIDRIVDNIPSWIAEKLISVLVESSSYAGIKYPSRAKKVF